MCCWGLTHPPLLYIYLPQPSPGWVVQAAEQVHGCRGGGNELLQTHSDPNPLLFPWGRNRYGLLSNINIT